MSDDRNFDRGVLREIFVDSLKANTILQGHNLQSIESLDNGQYKLVFDNGVTEIADLVIGADGTWSVFIEIDIIV
jgi:2-polyprenyl-6-methoxyphenol hydroxylase-like FAD-dependent oxidoreductase